MNKNLILSFLCVCFVPALATHAQQTGSAKPRESEKVGTYLESLQLERLLIEHLEFESASEPEPKKRSLIAQRLMGLYAEQMMQPLEENAPDWFAKSKLLLQTYPELASPAIRIAMLQSKYLINEKRFREWWYQGQPNADKAKVVGDWRELQRELTSFQRKLNADYQELASTLQTLTENRQAETGRLARLESLILHCNYLSGWSAYFTGILESEQRKKFLAESDSQFRVFLQIEPFKLLTEVPASWFDFTSDWNSRALVGLAMCQRGLGHADQSEYCFDLVEANATTQRTRDLRFLWELNSRLYLKQHVDAIEIVEVASQSSTLSPTGRVGFWLNVLKSAVAIETVSPNVSQQMGRAGLIGLTREFQAPLIEKYLTDNNLKLGESDFLSLWISGYLEFSNAGSSTSITLADGLYSSAKTKLEQAIEISQTTEKSTAPLDVARCRYLVGRINFVQEEFALAAPAFQETSELVFESDPQLAAESQWFAVRSWVELSSQNSRNQFKAIKAIDNLLQRFPGSTFAKRAEFEKLKISLAHLAGDQALERLVQIDQDDFNYPLAVNEIAKIKYQRWLNAFKSNRGSSDEIAQLRNDLFESEREYRELARASSESKAKTMLLTVDALLRDAGTAAPRIRQRLQLVNRTIEDGKVNGAVLQEYRYYEFLFANRIGDEAAVDAQTSWLRKNAQGTRFEKAALVQLAQEVDQQLLQTANPSTEDYARAVNVYRRLVDLLGDDDKSLKQSDNARVAFARLAEFKLIAGDRAAGIGMFEQLNQAFPKNQNYLRQLGVVRTESKKYDEALQIWQRLAAGVSPGSDLWFESKYWLAFCLMQSGQEEQALELHKQTIRLAGQLPPLWTERYEALLRSLSSDQ